MDRGSYCPTLLLWAELNGLSTLQQVFTVTGWRKKD